VPPDNHSDSHFSALQERMCGYIPRVFGSLARFFVCQDLTSQFIDASLPHIVFSLWIKAVHYEHLLDFNLASYPLMLLANPAIRKAHFGPALLKLMLRDDSVSIYTTALERCIIGVSLNGRTVHAHLELLCGSALHSDDFQARLHKSTVFRVVAQGLRRLTNFNIEFEKESSEYRVVCIELSLRYIVHGLRSWLEVPDPDPKHDVYLTRSIIEGLDAHILSSLMRISTLGHRYPTVSRSEQGMMLETTAHILAVILIRLEHRHVAHAATKAVLRFEVFPIADRIYDGLEREMIPFWACWTRFTEYVMSNEEAWIHYVERFTYRPPMCASPQVSDIRTWKKTAEIDIYMQCPRLSPNKLPDMRPLICSGCLLSTYCSKSCQKAHWGLGHRQKCLRVRLLPGRCRIHWESLTLEHDIVGENPGNFSLRDQHFREWAERTGNVDFKLRALVFIPEEREGADAKDGGNGSE
jgi:hypothetical protein